MSVNWTIDYTITLPTGVKTRNGSAEAFTRVETKFADKTYAVLKVVNGVAMNATMYGLAPVSSDLENAYEMVSFHDNQKLAESRASKENRECKEDIDTEFFAVPLTVRQRGTCYFLNNYNVFGNITDKDYVIIDTSAWGLFEWTRIAFASRKADLARHFLAGDHKFDGKHTRYDKALKKWVSYAACSVDGCYLPEPK